MFFRKRAANGFGQEYDRAHELREAFWGAIPTWKLRYESEATQTFLEWFRFGLFLKPSGGQTTFPSQKRRIIGGKTFV